MNRTDPVTLSSWLAPLLSFVAGYVDTVGFVALFGLFTAHVTGNFVLIGATLFQHDHAGLFGKLLALPVFIIAIALTVLLVRRLEKRGHSAVVAVLGLQTLLLMLSMAIGVHAAPIIAPDTPEMLMIGMLAVAAMAVQNAASRLVFTGLSPTTVMTGNVTQVIIDWVDNLAKPSPEQVAAAKSRLRRMLPSVVTFALGAIGGALLFRVFGFGCFLLAIILLLVAIGLYRSANARQGIRE